MVFRKFKIALLITIFLLLNICFAKTIKVGFFQMDGYHIIDEEGKRSGYGYELLQQISRYSPYTFEYIGYENSWAEMHKMLKNGEIDILTSAAKTPEREKEFEFSRNVIGTNYTILTVRSDNKKVISKNYSTYDGLRIGLLVNSTKNISFEKFSKSKSFSYIPVYFNDFLTMEKALQDGEIDGIVSSNLRSIDGERIVDRFNKSEFYIIAPLGHREVLDVIDNAIDELDLYEPGWRNYILNNTYNGNTKNNFYLHDDEELFFDQLNNSGGVLKVLVSPDRKPYSYFENRKAVGIIPKIFDSIANKIGFKYEVIQSENRAQYYSYLKQNIADIIIDAPYDYSSAEDYGYKLTQAYMSCGVSALIRSDFVGEIKTVATIKDSTLIRAHLEKYFKNVEYKYYDSIQACVDAVKNKEVDASFLYYYVVQDILNSDYRKIFSSRFLTQGDIFFSIGVDSNLPIELLKAINRALLEVKEKELVSIILEVTSKSTENVSLSLYLYRNPHVFIIIVAAFIFIIVVALSSILASKRLKRANLKLNEANVAKRDFLSKMSHDMRTPMNAIIGYSNIALKQDDIKEAHKYLTKISDSSYHLLSLINDVLDISRIEGGVISYEPIPTNLCLVVDSIISIVQGLLANRKINFTVNKIENNTHCCALIDELRVREILVNLLSNAIKFTDDGGSVNLSIEKRDSFDNNHKIIVFTVSDTGCGISEDFIPHVFEEFSQEDNGARTRYRGTGLGMAISKRYAQIMGGDITVVSKKGVGSTFTFSLPVELSTLCNSDNEENSDEVINFNEKSILLAEDNDLNAEIVMIQLEELGIKITRVNNGKEAVDAFVNNPPNTFDLILMDIMMPKMDGFEATRLIRNTLSRADSNTIPIIAMTANAFAEDIQASINAGMDAHIAKPIDTLLLLRVLNKYLNNNSSFKNDN